MKTVITSTGKELDSQFDLRFGRAAYFCLFNDESGEHNFIENENVNGNSGVGMKTAEKMVELGVEKVISGDFGPKAKDLLVKFNIQMVVLKDNNGTIEDILNKVKIKI
jgi:predicted Fe-Mo cluster-binding NifX family protein